MSLKTFDIDEFVQFLETQSDASKIYIGGDSERFKHGGVWWADYITVVVVHIEGHKGCKIFGHIERERDYDQKKDRPTIRLMTEVRKISEMYLRIVPYIERFELNDGVQIHLDLNAKKIHASNRVVNEAIGYIKAMTGYTPQIKPDAWSATYAADRYKEIINNLKNPPSASNFYKHTKRADRDRRKKKKIA